MISVIAGRYLILFFILFLGWNGLSVRAQIAEDAESICPALPGTKLPDVQLKDVDGKQLSLLTLASQKPTVLIVYRGGW